MRLTKMPNTPKDRGITERQLMYVNILLSKAVGDHRRKIYLDKFWGKESSKDLTFDEAHEIIEALNPDNADRDKKIAEINQRLNIEMGQKQLL